MKAASPPNYNLILSEDENAPEVRDVSFSNLETSDLGRNRVIKSHTRTSEFRS